MGDRMQGLHHKYNVSRTDGRDAPGGKHQHCEHFVLDITDDPHSPAALAAYADSCAADCPTLAADLRAKITAALLITVPEVTLPNGTVVPSFQVGKYHCSRGANNVAALSPIAKPWVEINFHDAKKACAAAGYKLITELQ